jgi:branched-chain amino acid transport system permease protein
VIQIFQIQIFQILADGLIIGSVISLGAIGLSLTLSMVRFSNFSHGELLAWGAYLALMVAAGLTGMQEGLATPIGPFSFGWGLVIAMAVAMALTAVLSLALDAILFKRLRKQGSITLVIASFGTALVLRNLLLFWQGGVPKYFSQNLQIAIPLLPRSFRGGLRVTPDQFFVLLLTLAIATGLHLFLRYSVLGRSMRASAINPALAQVTGIDPERILRAAWLISGALAAIAGVFAGITVQLRPTMGVDLLLPLFAAVVLGGIGSLWGSVLGGLIIGLAESVSVSLVGAEYRAAAAFIVLITILMVKPNGLFGERA